METVNPQEQNTATSAEKFLKQNSGQPASRTADYITVANAREYATLRIKELSEKGEPTDEEIKQQSLNNSFAPLEYESGAKWLRSELSPVIAALRAENKELKTDIGLMTIDRDHEKRLRESAEKALEERDEEIASLRAKLDARDDVIALLRAQLKSKGGKAHE